MKFNVEIIYILNGKKLEEENHEYTKEINKKFIVKEKLILPGYEFSKIYWKGDIIYQKDTVNVFCNKMIKNVLLK